MKYPSLTLIVIILGLLSRKFSFVLPEIVNTYLGDALWAMMIYFGARIFTKNYPIWKIGIASLAFCFLIECSQLYHAPWIDAIRHTTLGALILGFGFLWSDILAYTLGTVFAMLFDNLLRKNIRYKTKKHLKDFKP